MSNRILFLCSGGGGNLRFIYEAIIQEWLKKAEICCVLTDRACGANKFSTLKNIDNHIVDFELTRQSILLDRINSYKPDVIVSTVNKVISEEIVSAFRGRLINLHYSMLPAFSGVIGVAPVRQALKYGVKFVGTTVHFVSENVDAGVPIIQSVSPVHPDDTEELIMDHLFRCGSICLLTSIRCLTQQIPSQGSLIVFQKISDRKAYFNPSVLVPNELKTESFWLRIKNNYGIS